MVSPQQLLKKQYAENGIAAGSTHFEALWARDALFACFGSLSIKDYDIVKKTLDTLLDNLEDGHVPLRVGYKSQLKQYLGIKQPIVAVHTHDKGDNVSVDGNSLLLIVAEKYESASMKKLDHNKLKLVQGWIEKHQKEHFLPEGPCSSWEDSLTLKGPRLYTAVCHFRALVAASRLFKDPAYASEAVQTKIAIRKWWNGAYFTDGPNRNVCMTAGNLLAILWGVADPQQSKKILEYMASRKTIVPPAADKPSSSNEIHGIMRFIGLGQYHGTLEWSWLGAAEVACYHALGQHDEGDRRNQALRDLMERTGGVHELYENDKPFKNFFYKSEKNFAWTLGLLIASQPNALHLLR